MKSLSHVRLYAAPWTAAHQASLSFTISQSLVELMSIESVMPSSHLILCHLLLLLPSIFLSIRVFSNESGLRISWLKYWRFSIIPSNKYSGLISFRFDWFDFFEVQGTLKSFLITIVQKHQFFSIQPSLRFNLHICIRLLEKPEYCLYLSEKVCVVSTIIAPICTLVKVTWLGRSHQAPLSKGFSRQELWSGLPFPSPGDLPIPGLERRSPALQADALPSEPPGKIPEGATPEFN